MDFDTRSYLTRNLKITTVGEREAALLVLSMQRGAFEVLGGGSLTMPNGRIDPFIWVEPAALPVITDIDNFQTRVPKHEFRFIWDFEKPVKVSPFLKKTRLSIPLARLSMRFVKDEATIHEIALWFNVAKCFGPIARILKENRVAVLSQMPASPAEIRTLPQFHVTFEDDSATAHMVEELEALQSSIIFKES